MPDVDKPTRTTGGYTMTEEQIEMARNALKKMAHDVRTPMTSILGFTQLMLADESIEGENREFLELIEDDMEKLNQMILDTLDTIDRHIGSE